MSPSLPCALRLPVASPPRNVDNPLVQAPSHFTSGAVVLVTLNAPREKFWGAILEITPAGLSVRGIDLNSFDDFIGLVREGEPVSPGAVFFPMHRVERIELDLRNGEFPSLSDRFLAKTGREAAALLGAPVPAAIEVGCTLAEAERRFVEATLSSLSQDFAQAARLLGITEEHLRRLLDPASISTTPQGGL